MPGPAGARGAPYRGVVGLYALALMERDGPVHGYSVAEQIAERTEGAWRPGPGAIYPALAKLEARGLARARSAGRRRLYGITAEGRGALARIRARTAGRSAQTPDLSALWAQVVGVEDTGTFLLLRLRRALDSIDVAIDARPPAPRSDALRAEVVHELAGRLARLGGRSTAPTPRRRAAGRGSSR